MKAKLGLYFTVSTIFLFNNGCSKCDEADVCVSLSKFADSSPGIGFVELSQKGYFGKPCYNPDNRSQIVLSFGNPIEGLAIFDLTLRTRTNIFNGRVFSNPDWGVNGKIIFTREDFNVWELDPFENELTQLTDLNCLTGSAWRSTGDSFVANGSYCNEEPGYIIFSSDGSVLDQFTLGSSTFEINSDDVICELEPWGFSVFSFESEERDLIADGPFLERVSGCWLNNREIIWSFDAGIFITDYITRQTSIVLSSCDAITYHDPTYHPVSNKVIWQKVTKEVIGSGTLAVRSKLVIMNPDGTGEEELLIPND